jgi:hypothetical protein
MVAGDLGLVLGWRNHPAVRGSMLSQHEITAAEHQAWFERAGQDASRKLLVAHDGERALGFVHFSHALEGGAADWGFYAAPDAPRGSATASAADSAGVVGCVRSPNVRSGVVESCVSS